VPYHIKGVLVILGWKPPTHAYQEMVGRSSGCTTVPQVFVDGEHLGDEEVLQSLAEKGQLQRALKISA
tara:strand:+ start:282 stop:485 length:204 start_codon:yes stop_codon:yes gene_type:complete